jgi:hypothetical protein
MIKSVNNYPVSQLCDIEASMIAYQPYFAMVWPTAFSSMIECYLDLGDPANFHRRQIYPSVPGHSRRRSHRIPRWRGRRMEPHDWS